LDHGSTPAWYEHLALTSGPEIETRHCWLDHQVQVRLVAGGDAQVHGLERDQSCASVADFTVVRVILSIAARENRVVHSLDVSNAFVRASLAEVVYVRPPKILADRFGSKIMKVNKALYGLKQVLLSWHLHLEKMFDTVKIIKVPTPCLYAYNNCIIAVYVDDLIINVRTLRS
jgi:Reverse transcriptase (RNA-dependent DNA polymerase)